MSEVYGNYIIGDEFGKGGFCKVYLGTKEKEESEKKLYVIKVPIDIDLSKENKRIFNDEIFILDILTKLKDNKYTAILYESKKFNKIDDNNIEVNEIKEEKKEKEKAYYVMDYFSKGLLFDYFKSRKLSEKLAKIIFKKIVLGLQFLHKNKICHLDIKPENIVFDKNFWPVLIDFGFSKIYKNDKDEIILFDFESGSPEYACPELKKGKDINGEKVDIFSLGVVLYNLVTGDYGFLTTNYGIYSFIKSKKYANYWENIKYKNLSKDFKDLYVRMVAFDPKERPTLGEILESPWLQEINNINIEDETIKIELDDIYSSIKSEDEITIEVKIKEGGYQTRGIHDKNGIFKDPTLIPKKIHKNRLNINQYIKINGYLPETEIDFMNSLEKKICHNFDCSNEAFDEELKLEVNLNKKEGEIEIGECVMEIELLEYEKDENEGQKYLIEFVRKGGKYSDYYYFCSKIKEIIIKELLGITK